MPKIFCISTSFWKYKNGLFCGTKFWFCFDGVYILCLGSCSLAKIFLALRFFGKNLLKLFCQETPKFPTISSIMARWTWKILVKSWSLAIVTLFLCRKFDSLFSSNTHSSSYCWENLHVAIFPDVQWFMPKFCFWYFVCYRKIFTSLFNSTCKNSWKHCLKLTKFGSSSSDSIPISKDFICIMENFPCTFRVITSNQKFVVITIYSFHTLLLVTPKRF